MRFSESRGTHIVRSDDIDGKESAEAGRRQGLNERRDSQTACARGLEAGRRVIEAFSFYALDGGF